MKSERIKKLNSFEAQGGPVLYWMNRDMRLHDNWALLFAQHVAKKLAAPLIIVYNLDPSFLGGGKRQLLFKEETLRELKKEAEEYNISFSTLIEEGTVESLLRFCTTHHIGAVITDFSPLRIQKEWVENLVTHLQIPLYQVDTHNIIPVWITSQKQEFGAYTIRPKIHKLLPHYLEQFPKLEMHPHTIEHEIEDHLVQFSEYYSEQKEESVYQAIFHGGTAAAKQVLKTFLEERLGEYHLKRNDPNEKVLSELSPYLHYGCISAARIAQKVQSYPAPEEAKEAFLEELIVRRELSDNFCFYNPHYDSPLGYPDWAKKTHALHKEDRREYLYTLEEFEKASTHDALWNACQIEMMNTGKMNGYMRMYWAKKILEWTENVEIAHHIAITLNDRYELDGRDPNGYVGIAWALGGVHDRAWVEREIFGQIRYMNYNGCKRKFDVEKYINSWRN